MNTASVQKKTRALRAKLRDGSGRSSHQTISIHLLQTFQVVPLQVSSMSNMVWFTSDSQLTKHSQRKKWAQNCYIIFHNIISCPVCVTV